MTHPDYPTPNIETHARETARIVLVDSCRITPLIYSKKYDVYIIPGWWIDKWESSETAALREAREEVGCEAKILWEIWKIVEHLPAHGYSKGVNLIQKSHCYYGKVITKWEPKMTEKEISKGFQVIWVPIWEVLKKMKNSQPTTFKARLVAERDIIIFEKYLKLWNS